MYSVFFVGYINYGLIYWLASLKITSDSSDSVTRMMNGLYSEYNAQWCKNIGALICSTMLYKVVWPLVEFVCFYLIRCLSRQLD